MKALVIREFGSPDVLHFEDVPDPTPGPGEVRVTVKAVVVARTKDVTARAGRPPFGPLVNQFPHVFGTEHAGIVNAVGAGVDAALVGSRVAVSAVLSCGRCSACLRHHEEACSTFGLIGIHRTGAYAEQCVAPVENLHLLNADVSFAQAAALAANGAVAHAQLDAGNVGKGSVVLVLGAAGALGSTAAVMAAWRGAQVIGVDRLGSSQDRLFGLPLAAAVDGEKPGLEERILAATGPAGVDCVIDNLGIPALWAGYRSALAEMGRIVVSGAISHEPIPMHLLPFYLHSQSLIGVRTGNRTHIEAVWQDIDDGLRMPDEFIHTLPWNEASAAHTALEKGLSRGQAVLSVAD